MIKALRKVQAVVRGWKTRAKLSAELAKASVELGGAWELFELAPSEKVTKGPIKCKALLPKASGNGEMYVTTSYVCFDAEEGKEEEGLFNALLPTVSSGAQTQPLRLKIPLFDLESVAPKVDLLGPDMGPFLEKKHIQELLDAIWKHATFVKWEVGDILILDNRNTAHARSVRRAIVTSRNT